MCKTLWDTTTCIASIGDTRKLYIKSKEDPILGFLDQFKRKAFQMKRKTEKKENDSFFIQQSGSNAIPIPWKPWKLWSARNPSPQRTAWDFPLQWGCASYVPWLQHRPLFTCNSLWAKRLCRTKNFTRFQTKPSSRWAWWNHNNSQFQKVICRQFCPMFSHWEK